jgi:hypothetical protein
MSNYGSLFPPRPSDLPTRVTKHSDAEPYRPKRTRVDTIWGGVDYVDFTNEVNAAISETEGHGCVVVDIKYAMALYPPAKGSDIAEPVYSAMIIYREPIS